MTDAVLAAPQPPTRAPYRRTSIGVAIGLAVVSALSMLVAFVAQLSLFGQSSSDQFDGWTLRPVLLAGAIGLVAAAVAIWRFSRRPYNEVTAGVAIIGLGVCAVIGGGIDFHHRRHPQAFLLHAVTHIDTPAGLTTDVSSVGDQPADTALNLRAAPPMYGPPVGVRSWGPTTCSALGQTVKRWADSGSVRFVGTQTYGLPCLYRATYRGWPVFADILQRQTSGIGQVIVSTPGNDL